MAWEKGSVKGRNKWHEAKEMRDCDGKKSCTMADSKSVAVGKF